MEHFHDSRERAQQLLEDCNSLILESENLIEQSRAIINESRRATERAATLAEGPSIIPIGVKSRPLIS